MASSEDTVEAYIKHMRFSCTCVSCKETILFKRFGTEGIAMYYKLEEQGKLNGQVAEH